MARTVTYLPELVDQNIEVSVKHLKQFFKFGHGKNAFITKAVHDVSFDIKKGECFGVVGESGCGKTTTGRTMIRLYKATSGSVYFKGYRIAAGNRWNEKEIKWTKIRAKQKIKELQIEMDSKIKLLSSQQGDAEFVSEQTKKIQDQYNAQIDEIKANVARVEAEQKEKIAQHNYDNSHVDKKLMSKMQMIFQDPVDSLDPRMTVEDIIQEGLHIQGQYNKFENSQKVKDVLIKVGLLPEYASRYPHEFSGGQRQRIGIARALIMNPDFLICDEPISALDVSIRAQIINLLNNLKDEMGLTIMFIAHDLSVVKYFCDRIAVMYFGKLVELATSEELFRHPFHPYTVSLLSAIPKPNPLTEKERTRIVYKPYEVHDYSVDKPELREVLPGHMVYCNQKEFDEFQKRLAKEKEVKAKEKAARKGRK